jgi:hypothetical protein
MLTTLDLPVLVRRGGASRRRGQARQGASRPVPEILPVATGEGTIHFLIMPPADALAALSRDHLGRAVAKAH